VRAEIALTSKQIVSRSLFVSGAKEADSCKI